MTIEITNHLILKQFIEVLENLLSSVDFHIVSNAPTFTGLQVATLNDSLSCLIDARFSSAVKTHNKDMSTFCVDVNTLFNCLDSVDPDQSVTLRIDEEVVRFDVSQCDGMLNGASLLIPRTISEQEPFYLNNTFKYAIKFKQAFFRKYIKIFKKFKVDKVDFCLYRPNAPCHSAQPSSSIQSLYFAFRGDSDQVKDICFWFHSTVRVDKTIPDNVVPDNPTSVKSILNKEPPEGMNTELLAQTYVTIEDDLPPPNTDIGLCNPDTKNTPNLDQMQELYRERFQIRFLDHFTKNIDRNDITLYMANNLPLVLHFPIGDRSYIRFMLMMCEK